MDVCMYIFIMSGCGSHSEIERALAEVLYYVHKKSNLLVQLIPRQ